MARAVLVALAVTALASGARYADYSGVKMPEYSAGVDYEGARDEPQAPLDDYHDNAQDTPTNLDYKYEEEVGNNQKSLRKDDEDPEDWRKPTKKQRKSLDDGNLEGFDKYNSDDIAPKFKTTNRFAKHRPRLKIRNSDKDDVARKRASRHGRLSKHDLVDVDENIGEFHDDDQEKKKFSHRSTTLRVARRKPRDRDRDRFILPREDSDAEVVDDSVLRGRINNEDFVREEARMRPFPKRPEGQQLPRLSGAPGEDGEPRDIDSEIKMRSKEIKKKYDDYNDYYDMKRVQDIKEKLPALRRRPTTTLNLKMVTRVHEEDWPKRRMMVPSPKDDYPDEAESENNENTSIDIKSDTNTTTTTATTHFSHSPIPLTHSSPRIPRSTVTLSLAEKSRLSILKKAQRKEMIKGEITQKPPVLMQVTKQLQTLVIVEPPTSEVPWMRAREVHDESPDHLKKVKRLMRQKIVANAKSIHDLTENWDDMVCDYIDTSLIDNSAHPRYLNIFIILFTSALTITLGMVYNIK